MLDGINGAANRVNGGDLLDGGVNVDDDVDLGTRYCCEVAGLWGLLLVNVFPRVKVKDQDRDDQQVIKDYKINSVLSLKDVLFLSMLDSCFPVKRHEDVSPMTTARIPKSYVPEVEKHSDTSSEGSEKSKTKTEEEEARSNIRASSTPRPRAVISSPDNDALIQYKNKIEGRQRTALKNHDTVQNRHTTRTHIFARSPNLTTSAQINFYSHPVPAPPFLFQPQLPTATATATTTVNTSIMAATAAAAVASSFSQSINTLKSMRFKQPPADHQSLRIPSSRVLSSISHLHHHSYFTHELFPTAGTVHKWRALKVSAAVAEQETAATAPVEESLVEEKAETEGEVEGESAVNTKLYFGNLPYNVDSAQLAGIIQDYGSPELVEVLYDRQTGKSRGFAFVTMSTIEDCNTVIQNLDGSQYLGRTLRVNFSDKPKPKEPLYPETEFKLFVGNLSWSVTSESLTQAFQEYGNVVGARVLFDGETGRSRGYGFVSYSTKSEMEAAIQSLDGVELEGRALRVSLAQGRR
ncbi:hypothetical protein V6N13_054540 [Hibiscus sabdariffa]|uniref:RRM domain-containing protein n=1 Tax=Hibiscus sabdariffa TaxID=183260 RepID=A0ABR2DXH8_9ROSI